MRPSLLIGAIPLLAGCSKPPCQQGEYTLNYESPLKITGRIATETHYGPPNFGENPDTDRLETGVYIAFDKPVTVLGDGVEASDNVEEVDVARIQLAIPPGTPWPEFGACVTAEGKLFHAFNGHHHTEVLMTVSRITRP